MKNKQKHNISDLSTDIQENQLLEVITKVCGFESFRPKLEHLKQLLLADVNELESRLKNIFVIAGTNGKGECSHHIKEILFKNGKSVALWTSPHVLSITERFVYNDSTISLNELKALVNQYKSIAIENKLSFYEFLFFLYIKWVSKLDLDYIVLEVGLGGRFDAVNIFKDPTCAIVSISRDHEAILGSSLKGILGEKYGVTREGGKLYTSIMKKHLIDILLGWSKRDNIELIDLNLNDKLNYSIRNKALATRMCQDELGSEFNKDIVYDSSSKGRRELMTFGDQELIFIGAHNLDGHREMLKMMHQESESFDSILLGFSTGREKQVRPILKLYEHYPCVSKNLFLCDFEHPRAMKVTKSFTDIKSERLNFELVKNWKKIFNERQHHKKVLICGSYFFISDIQKHLLSNSSSLH